MDLNLAQQFLTQLDGHQNPIFAFRTFLDNKSAPKNPSLTTNRYGTLADIQDELVALNTKGAGIFFTVQKTDGQGYSTGNIVQIRACFVDLDGSPLEPVSEFKLKPQIIIESSPKRYHAYWLVDPAQPMALPMFEGIQSTIAERFNGDKTVKDLPRVMRLPGFIHKKDPIKPFMTTLISTHDTPPRYSAEQILTAFSISPKTGKANKTPIAIPVGQRETRLVQFAGAMRRMGSSESSILSALKIENQRCVVPMGDDDLIRIAHSIAKYDPVEGDFNRDKDGKIYANNQDNIKIALTKINVHVTYDLFSERYLHQREGQEVEHLNDIALNRLWLETDEAFRFRPSKVFWDTVVYDMAANKNKFHPVRDYLKKLEWDKKPRIDNWLIKYGGAADSEYTKAVGRIVLVAAVRRVMSPGAKFDEMLVLESPQGAEKSTALESLCPVEDWFSDNLPLNADSKKVIEQTRGKWIMEAAELSGMKKSDIEHLKSFLSRRVDSARMSYDRAMTERPRQFIVIGTTNSNQYLKDSTGNRRYWPVRVGKFEADKIRKDRDQLWAEAAFYEAQGESIRLDPKLWSHAEIQQERRRIEDPWETDIVECLADVCGRIITEDIWKIVGQHDRSRRTQAESVRLSEAMRRLGFDRGQIREGAKIYAGYLRGTEQERKMKIIISMDEDGRPQATIVARQFTAEWEQAASTKGEIK